MIAVHHLDWTKTSQITTIQIGSDEDRIKEVVAAWKAGLYNHVADVAETDLQEAYILTQNLDHAWASNPGVVAKVQNGRSTSVGDILAVNGDLYMVAPVGFTMVGANLANYASGK